MRQRTTYLSSAIIPHKHHSLLNVVDFSLVEVHMACYLDYAVVYPTLSKWQQTEVLRETPHHYCCLAWQRYKGGVDCCCYCFYREVLCRLSKAIIKEGSLVVLALTRKCKEYPLVRMANRFPL